MSFVAVYDECKRADCTVRLRSTHDGVPSRSITPTDAPALLWVAVQTPDGKLDHTSRVAAGRPLDDECARLMVRLRRRGILGA